jgi:VWFA-related protein
MKFFGIFIALFFVFTADAQQLTRDFDLKTNGSMDISNLYGKVTVTASEEQGEKVSLSAESQKSIAESEIKVVREGGHMEIVVSPQNPKARIDLNLKVPLRSRLTVETREGEVRISGNVESARVTTETGTISTDVPLDAVKFNFVWTASRPRYISESPLDEEVKEKAGGKFVLNGRLGEAAKKKEEREKEEKGDEKKDKENDSGEETASTEEQPLTEEERKAGKKKKNKERKAKPADKTIELNFTTARGIVLLNVNPSEVPSNLQERPLTEAAKAIVRNGDSMLVEAIRRSSPKYFGDYLKTLPPRKREPSLAEKQKVVNNTVSQVKQVTVKVTDLNNRAIGNLNKSDFTVTESGVEREILKVEPTTAPFNLVLLLDVSGSIDNYVDFIRKAARNFINTTSPNDRIAIVIFNEDVKQISTFTTDRQALSESLDTFDAGGGTAFFDSLAYTLVETLRPLRGERTAVVVLSDGDDNRSFLPFEAMLGSIQESGALIYPLYVPSDLIAASASSDAGTTADPLRARYMALTSKADAEGARLAQVSGGVYYPIRQLGELQKAYDDIVVQLRTAYTVTFRSQPTGSSGAAENRAAPSLKVKVARDNSFVNIGAVVDVPKDAAQRF